MSPKAAQTTKPSSGYLFREKQKADNTKTLKALKIRTTNKKPTGGKTITLQKHRRHLRNHAGQRNKGFTSDSVQQMTQHRATETLGINTQGQ